MKKNNKEKWINDVFESVKGSERAKPNSGLFEEILNEIDTPEAKVIPLRQLRIVAAAAVVLLVLNISFLRQNVKTDSFNAGNQMVENIDQSAISNYNIYE